jgi:hypothetical protein
MRLIDADRLLQALDDRDDWLQQISLEQLAQTNIYSLVNSQPTVKALEERPQGEWKLDEYGLPYCDKCNIHPDYTSNFCPNCGARM